ncbi:hepatocyte growth factor receptor-like [Saccoglossus kowalevskii]|uniref:Hepatocyte growth factor receptor-like n=1 Tax=Saccoglossus kowalevskii TaxID=10224 RepID=A0ABM0M370_SACKO|nr:PREDICTED: hepatocyte growth factor receptor-like [Saccoglossus kowalevskii]
MNEVQQVAVKYLNRNNDIEDVERFLKEGILMKDFNHNNVLSLLGVCIDDSNRVCIVLPYMALGDLKSYISNPEQELTVRKVLKYGSHVAQGMAYLASQKYVHRDLAARNCMLDESETVKVSDFGLSRDIYAREYYVLGDTKHRRLPIRWMAVESIKYNRYTTKSDVWSFGVFLWELLTRGELPYSNINNMYIPRYLENGHRLPQPPSANNEIYQLMMKCWHGDASNRPTFDILSKELQAVLKKCDNMSDGDENDYLYPIQTI